jgi:CDP-glycerol glycerophosphotransferase (TagB/SpsB family)
MICELLLILDKNNVPYHLIYKLHPAEYDSTDERWNAFRDNAQVEIVRDRAKSLYACFAQANIQIGVTSTAIFEGLAFGLKTYIYHIEIAEYMRDLVKKNYAEMFESAGDLFEKIIKAPMSSAEDVNDFFMPNAKENIVREIKKYL